MTTPMLAARPPHAEVYARAEVGARAEVCAVSITYHPDGGFPERLSRIVPQVGGVILVDNGSGDDSTDTLIAASASSSVTVIKNAENLGVAHALNIGVQLAASQGYTWAILLDQDTYVDANIVEMLLATHAACPDPERVAVVGSLFRDTQGRQAESCHLEAHGEHWQEVESVITSGSLLPLKAYAAIGPFRNEFFIDHVDTEFCFRARAAGYRVIETRQPLMSHTVGAPTHHRLLWTDTWTTNHSADRRYYIARNNTVLLREYGITGGGSWRWKSIVRSFRLCKRVAFYEQDKIAKIIAVGQGWWDGMRGHMGPRRGTPGASS